MTAIVNSDSNTIKSEHEFDFIGGNLCLDFANTVGGLPPESLSQERLTDYTRLVLWSQQAGLLSESQAQILLRKAAHTPLEATAILERACTMRETIRSIFAAVALGTQPTASDLDSLNSELDQAMAGARVIIITDGFGLEWRQEADRLDQMLAPIARSAATLLTSAQHKLVRECANEQCHWLFVDTTKNHSRQWCRTTGCGNVMRVRKHREQQRSKE